MRKRVPFLLTLLVGLVLFSTSNLRADLVAHFSMDGFIEDEVGGLEGTYFELGAPTDPATDTGFDGSDDGAIAFDAANQNVVLVDQGGALPLYNNPAYSVAMWVKADFTGQNDDRVYSESSSTNNNALLNIGTHNTGADGTVDIFIRNAAGQQLVAHRHSQGVAFDGTWHHIAWVDDNGQAVLYIDGVLDGTDFSYTKGDMPVDASTIGGILRGGAFENLCCQISASIDDVRLYDHALTEEEVVEIVSGGIECPADGDTHCGDIVQTAGPDDGSPGAYTFTAEGASDDSGDTILYFFEAISDTETLTSGPSPDNTATFDLGNGEWAVRVTVDDQGFCPDEADDNSCSTEILIGCPIDGDTHCNGLQIIAPEDGSPGIVTAIADATDDSGDPIIYTFTADNGVDAPIVQGPTALDFVEFNLGEGDWTISLSVDDNADCDDVADDNTCSEQVILGCPEEGDTHLEDVIVTGPSNNGPGNYFVEILSSFDDSGDPIIYRFEFNNGVDAPIVTAGDGLGNAAAMLGAGTWTLTITVDDDPNCDDVAEDGTHTEEIVVEAQEPQLVSHWTFDETTEDSQASGNDGVFINGGIEADPIYVEGFDGNPVGAILFDGIGEIVHVTQNENLPISAHGAYTVALWVNGPPPGNGVGRDLRVFSEGSDLTNQPLLNIGTNSRSDTGEVDIYIRGTGGDNGHPLSQRVAFDETWHHIAFVDDNGVAKVYIDGILDATDFTYDIGNRILNTTSIGGIRRAADSHWFPGAIDDVRVYNYALSQEEVEALIPSDGCPEDGDSHCGELTIEGPEGNLFGDFTLSATGASDDSGDPLIYTFTAIDEDGNRTQFGPSDQSSVVLNLIPGTYSISLEVDDDLACFDRAEDSTCTVELEVVAPEPEIISHFTFDETLEDSIGNNDGSFLNGEPTYVDGVVGQAVQFDGLDDIVLVQQNHGLPLTNNPSFSVAMWVNGGSQNDRRVFSESSSTDNNPLFNLGTERGGTTGQFDLFIRNGPTIVNHRLSEATPFDNTWHHIVFTMDPAGNASLWVDGVKDSVDMSYARQAWAHDTTTIGGILRATTCCLFNGMIDEVYLFNYVLEECEIETLSSLEEQCDPVVDEPEFRRGDTDGNGALEITDPINNLAFQFLGTFTPPCMDAADFDDNGKVEITDPIANLSHQFLGTAPPAPPGKETCGVDPTPLDADGVDLGCETLPVCDA